MKIALAQINTVVGDLDGNTNKIVSYINQARLRNADLVVFPELAITGYPPQDLLLKESFVKENKEALKKIIENSKGLAVIVGFVDYDITKKGKDGRIAKYNSAALIRDKQIIGIQNKTLLPTFDVFDEARYFIPAKKSQIFKINQTKIGIEICEDLWDINYGTDITGNLAKQGADIIIAISASPFHYGKRQERESLLKNKAKQNNLLLTYLSS